MVAARPRRAGQAESIWPGNSSSRICWWAGTVRFTIIRYRKHSPPRTSQFLFRRPVPWTRKTREDGHLYVQEVQVEVGICDQAKASLYMSVPRRMYLSCRSHALYGNVLFALLCSDPHVRQMALHLVTGITNSL